MVEQVVTTAQSTPAIRRVYDLTADLSFAPLPVLLDADAPEHGWRAVSALDLAATPASAHSVAHVLAAERSDGTPAGPHAVHGLRSLAREMIFSTAASLYLVGRVTPFDADTWQLRTVGTGPGSVQHGLHLTGADVAAPAAAECLVDTITPLVAEIREQTRVGRRTLWSYVIDMSRFAMINLARQLGRDRGEAWRQSGAWGEALHAAGAPRLSSPELAVYDAGDPNGTWAIRGACCLDFRDPGHGYCVTCPILDHDTRAARWLT